MTNLSNTIGAIKDIALVALVVWVLLRGCDKPEADIVTTHDTVHHQPVNVYQPKETSVIYRDTVINHTDTFYDVSECQEAYQELWRAQMGLLQDCHAVRTYDSLYKDSTYTLKTHIEVSDNKLLQFSFTPSIINTTTTITRDRFALYGGLYVHNTLDQNSYGAILTIPVRDLQFSVGKNFSDRGWFGSVSTKLFNR